MKDEYKTVSKNVMNILDDEGGAPKSAALNAENLRKLNELGMDDDKKDIKPNMKKGKKPAWAQTQEEI